MKKLMLIVGVLMIAGGISAHGYGGYRGGYGGYHERVVVARPYYDPYVVARPPVYYGGGYGYRPAPVYRGYGGYHGGYQRGGRCR